MKKFIKFTNPLILDVIRGFYLSNNGMLHHSNLSLDKIDTKVKLDLVTKLANLTDEQINEIENEIDFVLSNNKKIQVENNAEIDAAVLTLKRLDIDLLSMYLDENVDYPRPEYYEWMQFVIMKQHLFCMNIVEHYIWLRCVNEC